MPGFFLFSARKASPSFLFFSAVLRSHLFLLGARFLPVVVDGFPHLLVGQFRRAARQQRP